MRDLSFKRRLRRLQEQAQSIFFRWCNLEIFSVLIARELFLYMIVLQWWAETAEYTSTDQIPMLWLYILSYYWMNDVGDVRLRKHDQVSQRHSVLLGIPVLICVARWGNYSVRFCDVWLEADGDPSRTLVGSVSDLFRWALGRSDRLYVWRGWCT